MTDILQRSKIRLERFKLLLSIILFAILYIALFLGGLRLVWALLTLTFELTVESLFLTIPFAIGIIILILTLGIFLSGFFRPILPRDYDGLIPITKKEEPELFKVIYNLSKQVNTTTPNKIYLTPDFTVGIVDEVNLGEIFKPRKKVLLLGIGIVNSLYKEELYALLLQQITLSGSNKKPSERYVYIIHEALQQLFNNSSVSDDFIRKAAENTGVFVFFVNIADFFIGIIFSILQFVHNITYKSFIKISDHMEVLSDIETAKIVGSKTLELALTRVHLASISFDQLLDFFNSIPENQYGTNNIYELHHYAMIITASQFKHRTQYKFPKITAKEIESHDKSKLELPIEWEYRKALLKRVGLFSKVTTDINQSNNSNEAIANELLINVTNYQEEFTTKIFDDGKENKTFPIPYSLKDFQVAYDEYTMSHNYGSVFNGYYDLHYPLAFPLSQNTNNSGEPKSFKAIFSDEIATTTYIKSSLEQDIETLWLIRKRILDIPNFTYDKVRYKRTDCKTLIPELEKIKSTLSECLRLNDQEVYRYFLNIEDRHQETKNLYVYYNDFFRFTNEHLRLLEICKQILLVLNHKIHTGEYKDIKTKLEELSPLEKDIKKNISQHLHTYNASPNIVDKLTIYASNNVKYTAGGVVLHERIQVFREAIENYQYLIKTKLKDLKNHLIGYQQELLSSETNVSNTEPHSSK